METALNADLQLLCNTPQSRETQMGNIVPQAQPQQQLYLLSLYAPFRKAFIPSLENPHINLIPPLTIGSDEEKQRKGRIVEKGK
uniref:Uncharacterized protein n=1 Tax=Rhizophora mucronata TaxID=61149 RepID=A0A2P2JSV8_RHIMU